MDLYSRRAPAAPFHFGGRQSPDVPSAIAAARDELHRTLIEGHALALRQGVVTTADRASTASKRISQLLGASLCARLGLPPLEEQPAVDAGSVFEARVAAFLDATLTAIPSGTKPWFVEGGGSIGRFAQYAHLHEIDRLSEQYPELRIYLGGDYLVHPDICVSRRPVLDEALGEGVISAEENLARATFLRAANNSLPIIHASVSCKWTLRSDRAQNARTEALNLLRNRKGRAPSVVLVTAEPMPTRLASLAYGTGDVDRIYHFALYELEKAVKQSALESPGYTAQTIALKRMIDGLRLADISDLPFDLLV